MFQLYRKVAGNRAYDFSRVGGGIGLALSQKS